MKFRTKQWRVIELRYVTHRRLLKVHGNQTADLNTLRHWIMRFSAKRNANQRITIRKLPKKLDAGFDGLYIIMTILDKLSRSKYHVGSMYGVFRLLTQYAIASKLDCAIARHLFLLCFQHFFLKVVHFIHVGFFYLINSFLFLSSF